MLILKGVLILLQIFWVLAEHHEIKNLFGDLYADHPIYSGYLETGVESHKLFYVFTPSQSETPESDPVIAWIHGGPGCSGMEAFIVESGPVVFDRTGSEFFVNDYAWNKLANVIYFDSPAGTGFSTNTDSDWSYNSDQVSEQIIYALDQFFTEFPQYKENEFYFSGFSYAGAYIPYMLKNYFSQEKLKLNVKGAFIGNGITSTVCDAERSMVYFLHTHGTMSDRMFHEFKKNCPFEHYDVDDEGDKTSFGGLFDEKNVTKKCNQIRREIRNNYIGNDLYGLYRPCPKESDNADELHEPKLDQNSMESFAQGILHKRKLERRREILKDNKIARSVGEKEELEPEITIWPTACENPSYFGKFLNTKTVQEKMGVSPDVTEWIYCNPTIFASYHDHDSIDLYEPYLFKNNLRIWHFSGDGDACIATIGTMKWIKDILNLTVKEEWRQWHCDGQVVGFVQGYEKNFALITFIGAGHQVPSDRRKESFLALQGFLKNELPK